MKLEQDQILFVDGIDIRPTDISYNEYIQCIQGLASATWHLNTEFFANIRDSRGRIKVMLLVRPDIFTSLGYQNPNARVRDNGIVLDWRTTYEDYRSSRILRLIDGLLGKQQKPEDLAKMKLGSAWDYYFPYTHPHLRIAERIDNPFIEFLRYSFYRPRDIISFLIILQRYSRTHKPDVLHFSKKIFERCQSEYSDYLLGEVRDYLTFYHSNVNFDDLVAFFSLLEGRSYFDYRAPLKIHFSRSKSVITQ